MKWLYSTGRGLTWVVFSTASVLFLPVIIETQLLEIEEAAKQQQRQILLGPGSAGVLTNTSYFGFFGYKEPSDISRSILKCREQWSILVELEGHGVSSKATLLVSTRKTP